MSNQYPAKIVKILRPIKYGPGDGYAVATVLTSEGEEARVFIGGEIETFFHSGVIKAHIKRNKPKLDTPMPDMVE